MFTPLSTQQIIVRRTCVVIAGVLSFPVMVFMPTSVKSRVYSYLHKVWLKTSTKPVWLQHSEQGAQELY
ncbi:MULTISPECIES: DUF2517 family protein [Photobacterium]|uniref:DUF2517 family protein n=1 Tax=Photobacterium halotolerans TaxID=265726 RepID=A0A7X4WEF1_9GAMM|nr:DUF2517 family protein [Photobacterium halotolerans]NAW67239.1 DUF2517 family protein [Photobacterium halotolerans]NAW85924.1 DUF2517 family protein [Photobacterium halotolerans]NAX48733.1 DUF2517 family protein [Photobacterium halotolerans]